MLPGANLSKFIQDLRASYWFLPSSLVVCAVCLSFVTLMIDGHPALVDAILPETLSNTQLEGARTLMSIISQSTFGVAGVMFSMTMVAVSFASGNFGPRLIGNFMRDRGNQWSLGVLIATFVYALMITRAIQDPMGQESSAFVPHMSIAVALVLMAISVFTVIYFVHHIPETINVANITGDLGTKLIAAIKQAIESHEQDTDRAADWPDRAPDHTITLGAPGYIQTLDIDAVREIAEHHDLRVEVVAPVGTFISEQSPALHLWGAAPSDKTQADLRGCFALGHNRTEHQNLFFVVQQLVEMAARALSPGVNDPFTAMNCMNWLYAACVVSANYKEGLKPRTDNRIRRPSVSFPALLEEGFGKAHAYTETDQMCDNHVESLLDRLDLELEKEADQRSLRRFRARLGDRT